MHTPVLGLAGLAVSALCISSCAVGEPLEFASGVYESEPAGVWMDIRVDADEVVFYDSDGASIDADGHVRGEERHRERLGGYTDEERGIRCGDGLWYDAAQLDGSVVMNVGGRFYSWPYLNYECDRTHLILSPDRDALTCDGVDRCFRFSLVRR